MTTPHPKADLLRAIADGKQMQSYRSIGDPWVDINPIDALRAVLEGYPCRIKPETVIINGVECHKHNTKAERNWVSITCANGREGIYCFDLMEDAIKVYEALIKPLQECHE